jgi:hypothetical protein
MQNLVASRQQCIHHHDQLTCAAQGPQTAAAAGLSFVKELFTAFCGTCVTFADGRSRHALAARLLAGSACECLAVDKQVSAQNMRHMHGAQAAALFSPPPSAKYCVIIYCFLLGRYHGCTFFPNQLVYRVVTSPTYPPLHLQLSYQQC